MALFNDICSWLGYKGLYALLGASLVVIVVTNLTIKTSSNLFLLSVYDFVNMVIFLGLVAACYFLAYVCPDISSYGFLGVAPTIFVAAGVALILFNIRAPLFTDTGFNVGMHLIMPLVLALMMALAIYPILLLFKKLSGS